jgi:hypothetical protein
MPIAHFYILHSKYQVRQSLTRVRRAEGKGLGQVSGQS